MNDILVKKSSGELVPFSMKKLKYSLEKSGASQAAIKQIAHAVEGLVVEGMSTKKIYRHAYNLLKKIHKPTAARYKLKKGIMELGPSGYSFEKFVGELLKHQGYGTQVGEIVKGKCVSHEIDVIAEKDGEHYMIECKYHNSAGTKTDVKVPLYIQSRFIDVQHSWKKLPGHEAKFHQGWVITNTQFTTDAIDYGTCVGLNLISWNYPLQESLKDIIDRLKLYPLTCLSSITKTEKKKLLDKNMVLCKELCNAPDQLKKVGISANRTRTILEEAHNLCNGIF